jgi:adenylosuccinate lyase
MTFDHQTYISPFSWRYGSPAMRQLWSETHKRRLMRQVWVALAAAQHQAGLVTADQLADLQSQADNVDIARSLEIEQETRHDVMAEIRTFAEQCPVGGGIIHWGATSADITDNVDVLRLRAATDLLIARLQSLLLRLADKIEETAVLPTMAHTHIQPAEPTTLGYRFAVYAQDLLEDLIQLQNLNQTLRGRGHAPARAALLPHCYPNLHPPARFARAAGVGGHCRLAAQIRPRFSHFTIAAFWRMGRTVWQKTGWLVGHALQA